MSDKPTWSEVSDKFYFHDRIAELERENEALKKAGNKLLDVANRCAVILKALQADVARGEVLEAIENWNKATA